MPPIVPRQIEIFRTVMRAGGASAAARLLGLSQPLISQQLARLEQSLDLKLFDRQRGRLHPTREAQAWYREVESHYVSLETLARKAHSLRDGARDQLFVGCMPALGLSLMPEVVQAFRADHPHVRVSIQATSAIAIRSNVASGEWDIGYTTGEAAHSGLVHASLADVPNVAVLPTGHPLAGDRGQALHAGELARYPFIALNPEDVTRTLLNQWCRAQGHRLDIVAETPYAATVCEMVAQGVGIGVINPLTAHDYVQRGLAMRRLSAPLAFTYVQVQPPGTPADGPTQDFLRHTRIVMERRLAAIDDYFAGGR